MPTDFQTVHRMRLALDDLRTFNERSSRFVAEAARELRTPLQALAPNSFQTARLDAVHSFHEDRAKRTRDLAEKTHDAAVKRILLSLADCYDRLSE